MTGDNKSIIPYVVIKSMSMLENLYEARLFGWILARAQSVLKLYNKDLSCINLQYVMDMVRVTIPARMLLSPGDDNYKCIKKAFILANKHIDYEREGHLFHLNIIAFPQYRKERGSSTVTCIIHNELWHAMLDFSKGFRIVNLETYMRLQSVYSIIMYVLISQQKTPFNLGLDTLKQLLGCADKQSYKLNANFFARVLNPAMGELKQKSDWYFEYTTTRGGGKGGAYSHVTIIPTGKTPAHLEQDDGRGVGDVLSKMRLRCDEDVSAYLQSSFGMTPQEIERTEPLLDGLGGDKEHKMEHLSQIRFNASRARNVRNVKGYLVNALKNLNEHKDVASRR